MGKNEKEHKHQSNRKHRRKAVIRRDRNIKHISNRHLFVAKGTKKKFDEEKVQQVASWHGVHHWTAVNLSLPATKSGTRGDGLGGRKSTKFTVIGVDSATEAGFALGTLQEADPVRVERLVNGGST